MLVTGIFGQRICCVSYWNIWGRVVALLVTAINLAENCVRYLLGYLGQRISSVRY